MRAAVRPSHPPPLSAAEALSTLLWQPYDCRTSPPLVRSRTDGCLPAAAPPQSPRGGRHARASLRRSLHDEMRLAVPAPVTQPARKCAVSVRVSGEPSAANVSSVHIVPDDNGDNVNSVGGGERSFASAECQTEEPQRRRRRRVGRAPMPDLLDAHPPPPPYSTLPPATISAPAPAPAIIAAAPAPILAAPVHRFPFQPIPLRRSGRYACSEADGSGPKSCCGLSGARPPLRWCVLLLGVAGVCCVAAGAVLGALRPHPRAHLTLLLLMIGIGVVLVTCAGLAWRLGSRESPCVLLGLRRSSCRRLVPRLPPTYARPHHPYAAMLYPEFHYRPPPPTYQASMQEYRLRLLLLDRSVPAMSPPPTYRSNAATLVRCVSPRRLFTTRGTGWCGTEYSGPPSYRPPTAEATQPPTPAPPMSAVIDELGIESLEVKYADDNHITLPTNNTKEEEEEKDDSNLVRIVQTSDVTVHPVIVTVSGEIANSEPRTTSEIDILAHL